MPSFAKEADHEKHSRLPHRRACLLPTLGLAATVTLNPVADAYVQNGKNAAKNYGTNTQLRAQTNSTAASNYDSYLRFDTGSAAGQVTSARLRLYASLSKAGSVSSSAHAVADTGWGETTLTWNNKPALGAALGGVAVVSTSYAWQEIDVTAYVQSERAAGRNLVSLGLHNAATSSVYVRANSRNATSNKPELVILTAAANVSPSVSLSTPADGSTHVSGEAIIITANAADSDGSIASVGFHANGTLLSISTGTPYKLTTSLAAGSYSLTAVATDDQGAATTSAPVSITVTPAPNVPPTVSMTGPADGSTYAAPASVTLSADATDSDGSIVAVEFYNGGTLIASVATPPYTTTWSDVPVGNYSVRARAVDDRGGETYSNTIAVNVNATVATGVYYVYADHLNTPRVITDGSNKIVWRWDSDPFGADAANEDPDGDGQKFSYNLRFPGQYYDRETGLHYNYFRDYETGTGRYVQSDPIGLAGGLNTYGYVGGNSVSKKDPFGLEGISVSGGVSGFVATLGGSSTSGVVFGNTGQTPNACYQSVVCGRAGVGLAFLGSIQLGYTSGQLCSGQKIVNGVFAQGALGVGLGGAGSLRVSDDGSSPSLNSGNIGPQVGWGGAGGVEQCVVTLVCANDPPCCKQPGGCKRTCDQPMPQIGDIVAP